MFDWLKKFAALLKTFLCMLGILAPAQPYAETPGSAEPPEDPYASVGAPKKPRLPGRSAAAVAEFE